MIVDCDDNRRTDYSDLAANEKDKKLLVMSNFFGIFRKLLEMTLEWFRDFIIFSIDMTIKSAFQRNQSREKECERVKNKSTGNNSQTSRQ